MSEFRRIAFGFVEDEDRLAIALVADEESVTLLLTRRLTGRLLRALTELLAKSSPVMARAPVDMKKDVLLFEHLSARQEEAGPASPSAASPPSDMSGAPGAPADESAAGLSAGDRSHREGLLKKLDIETLPHCFRLVLTARGDISVSLALNRSELHRLLASLHAVARTAEWQLEAEAGWLVDGELSAAAAS
jgi:hypothetical protein